VASRLAEEALVITERSGYVRQEADVRLFLTKIEREIENGGWCMCRPHAAGRHATARRPYQ